MLFPGAVENLQEQGPLHPPHLGPEMVFDNLRNFAPCLFAVELGQVVAGKLRVAGVLEPGREIDELAVVTGDGPDRCGGAALVAKQRLDLLLRFGCNLVGPLVVSLAVLDEQRVNFFALLVLEVVDRELGVESPLGPLDQVLAQEALSLAAGTAGRETVQAGEYRVLRLAQIVRGNSPLMSELV